MASIIKLEPDDVTILVAGEAVLQGGLFVKKLNYMRQHADNWSDSEDAFFWTVESPLEGEYEVTALMNEEGKVELDVEAGSQYILSGKAP